MKKLLIVVAMFLVLNCFPVLPDGGSTDAVIFKVQLLLENEIDQATKYLSIGSTEGWYVVGSSTDKWDTTWTYSNFDLNFGIYFEVDEADGEFEFTLIDVVQAKVHFSGGTTGWCVPSQYSSEYCNWQWGKNCEEEDGRYAYVKNLQPNEMLFYDFGFDIPENSVILGIEVRVKGYCIDKL